MAKHSAALQALKYLGCCTPCRAVSSATHGSIEHMELVTPARRMLDEAQQQKQQAELDPSACDQRRACRAHAAADPASGIACQSLDQGKSFPHVDTGAPT